MTSALLKNVFVITLLMVCLLVPIQKGWCQQKPVISQYMFEPLLLNPSYAGSRDHLSATALFRYQWVNIEGAPQVQTLAAHTNIKDRNIGVGAIISNEQVGVHNSFGFYGCYSYKIETDLGELSMGLQAGFDQVRSDYTKLTLSAPDDPVFQNVVTDFKPNFGTGANLISNNTFIGVSVPYILNKRVINDNDYIRNSKEARYYYLKFGRLFNVHEYIILKPTALLRFEDNSPMAADINLTAIIDERIQIGASYRFSTTSRNGGDNIVAIYQIQLTHDFYFGYSFDFVLSDLNQFTLGTHEAAIKYVIDLYKPKSHKSCPYHKW